MPKRVLLIDQDQGFRVAANAALQAARFAVKVIADPVQAESAVANFNPDVIVIDPRMPGLDGMAILKRLAASGNASILVSTADDSEEMMGAGNEPGVARCEPKSSGVISLVDRVREMTTDEKQPGTSVRPRRILFAEDTDETRDAITEALRIAGYVVKAARNGREALEFFESFEPDGILLDIRMPEVHGLDVLRTIRKTSRIPVLMFSVIDDKQLVTQAVRMGANDYVLKSMGALQVVSRVEKLLGPALPIAPQVAARVAKRSALLLVHPDQNGRKEIREQSSHLIERMDILEVDTGAAAIEAAAKQRINLMITGWDLPDADTAQVIRTIKRMPGAALAAIVVASEKSGPEMKRKAEYAGADEFVGRPWDDGSLSIAVASAMTKFKKRRRTALLKKRQSGAV